jgi:hypothetical protein
MQRVKVIEMRFVIILFLNVFFLLIGGCGGANTNQSTTEPGWVLNQQCPANIKSNVLCAVGEHAIENRRQRGLAVRAAIATARANLTRQLQTTSESMLKKYQGEYAEGPNKVETEGRTTEVIKEWTKMSVVGTQTVATWVSPDKIIYVVVSLDMQKAKELLLQNKRLSEGMKKMINARADKEFKELSELELK